MHVYFRFFQVVTHLISHTILRLDINQLSTQSPWCFYSLINH